MSAGARAPAEAVILAAGAGLRLGGRAKATLRSATGDSFLAAVAACARAAGVMRAVVVVGPPHQRESADEAARLGLEVVLNPEPARGMASSLALGFARLRPDARCGLLWPVDHAAVQVETVRAIAAACPPAGALVPTWQGRGGHPSAFAPALWPALIACASAPAGQGARDVLRSLPSAGEGRLQRLAVADAGVRLDVDTPADLARIRSVSTD
ncbi:nucleotidyltransferase family protein [Haliangium ochraceum]|uniref:MobA-like NTP transferase domain-containing protein n=1 Tax=Haliangium ochraceum (strain DSM 14365 / JCM 11303 / SMP-2) TaxID=502025 RepID=D0LWN1_HALO1|nr:NTP transferase domain-containing protein [Haliangium ochraceum]ACY17681.1 conserved hypothetical protein [Haliangium ochraceum DSM 14365]